MITFDQQELTEIVQAVSSADNTDAMPAYAWARAAKVLLAEVERLRGALEEIAHFKVTPYHPAVLARRALEGKEVEK